MLLIISNPKLFSNATISGLKLFYGSVLPGLFPFMFLTKLLTEHNIPQRNNIEKLTTQKELGKQFLEGSKKTDAQKAAMKDLLASLEEQIALEPQNIELRQAYEAIKSSL